MKGYKEEVYVDFLDKSKDIQMMKSFKKLLFFKYGFGTRAGATEFVKSWRRSQS